MAELTDLALHALLDRDPERGWCAFVDQYTATLVALIERAGVVDRDEVTDVYVLVCERLADNRCARLRRHDPARGALAAWLTIVVRHVVVDWARAQHGRRRLFGAIARLDGLHRRAFELYYWEHRTTGEMAELLSVELGRRVDLAEVLDALATIDRTMTDRHRSELLAFVARTRRPLSLEPDDPPLAPGVVDRRPNPEESLRAKQLDEAFIAALRDLPPEDAAIVRLKFVRGWTRDAIRRALQLDELPAERVSRILAALRSKLADRGVGARDAVSPGLGFLEEPS